MEALPGAGHLAEVVHAGGDLKALGSVYLLYNVTINSIYNILYTDAIYDCNQYPIGLQTL